MASSVSLGYMAYSDGMTWTSLLQRSFVGGVAAWDANSSLTAANPLGGVIPGPGSPLAVTQEGSPGMAVLVNAGYCAVPHLTQGHGVYLFGLQSQGTLTVAANSSGATRVDIVIARVYDEGNNTSYCDVEIIEGTPGSGQPATPGTSILLAAISVASGASSITNSNITDKRAYTVAPGGILPASTAAAPPLSPGQLIWNTGTGALERLTSPVTQVFTYDTQGTYSLTIPDSTVSTAVQGWAPGAPGGGSAGEGGSCGSGGGEYAEWDNFPISPGDVLDITVGAPGTPSEAGSDDSTAGTATAVTYGLSTLTANPGQPGTASAPGLGGTGSTAPVHFDGGPGGYGTGTEHGGGGGGGSGGPGSAGNPGGDAFGGFGGQGAYPVPGGGPGGDGGSINEGGFPPYTGPGGGGGATSGNGAAPGQGAPGQVTVTCLVQPSALTALASADSEIASIDTSTGTQGSQGATPAMGSSAYGWGIGYGNTSYSGGYFGGGGDADGTVAAEIQQQFTADGATDFQIDVKWGMAVPEAAVDSASPSVTRGQCRIIIMIDSTILDTVYLSCAASGGVTRPGDAGSFTYYTSALNGTTPAAGTHTATLAVQTENTLSGQLSGAHVGNLASTGTSADAFGSVPGYFTSALTAENCYLRVAGILASAI